MSAPESLPPDWLADSRNKSAEALSELLEQYRNYLLLVAERELQPALRPKGGASDLVQDTLLDAVRAFDQFRGETEAELKAWLHRMLLNNVKSFARRYHVAGKRQIDREVRLGKDSSAPGVARLAAATPTPSRQLMAGERASAIQKAMERLPEEYRRVIQLRYEQERPFDDIGKLLGLTPNAARKLWVRAIKRLRQESEGPA